MVDAWGPKKLVILFLGLGAWQVGFFKFFEVLFTPNMMILVEFATTNIFIADIAVPCQLC